MIRKIIYALCMLWYLLPANTTFAYTHADTLRGSNGRGRDWWKVVRYDLSVDFDTSYKRISGVNTIEFKVIGTAIDSMQIDLDARFNLEGVIFGTGQIGAGHDMEFSKLGNVIWVKYPFHSLNKDSCYNISIVYSGSPRIAVNPPWDGGLSVKKDAAGKPWVAVSCQGLGASAWWPCKDAQWEEPDSGMNITIALESDLAAVSNGRLIKTIPRAGLSPHTQWCWHVANPINNYDVSFYIGDYVHWHDTLIGEKGKLDLDYWVLRENEARARKQFAVVKQMIHCFEYWMGPYPFYEDGYKLVEAPYLGMEHQSAIAYGNDYKMGYKGYDRTGTGVGMNFDYIIVHESGHEWFGNNVTAKDIADNWIHEGITTYSETLFEECLTGKDKAAEYCRGEWHNIQNDKPMIGPYGVNEEGSNDIYDKGTAMMHMIRTMTGDDEKFRMMLRGLGQEYYHKMVTTPEVESYIASHTGLDLKAFFNQYLRTNRIPKLEYYIKKRTMHYRFTDTEPGFTLPLTASSGRKTINIQPSAEWQETKWKGGFNVHFSKDFLFEVK